MRALSKVCPFYALLATTLLLVNAGIARAVPPPGDRTDPVSREGVPSKDGFDLPSGIAVDHNGNLFVADLGQSTITEILASGRYSTVTPFSSDLGNPTGVAVDGAGNVFVVSYEHHVVKEILAAGGYNTITTVGGAIGGHAQIAIDSQGNLFVTDGDAGTVTEMLAADNYSTKKSLGSGIIFPNGIAVGRTGNLFVAENKAVKEILAAGGYTTVKRIGGDFAWAIGIAIDRDDNVFVADRMAETVTEIVSADGYATSKLIFKEPDRGQRMPGSPTTPVDVAVDSSGNIFMAEEQFSHMTPLTSIVKEILAAGDYTIVKALKAGSYGASKLAVDANGDIFVTDQGYRWPRGAANGAVKEILGAGDYTTVSILGGTIADPGAIAVTGSGDVVVADTKTASVYLIHRLGSSVTVKPVGSGFVDPELVSADAQGNIFVSDVVESMRDGVRFLSCCGVKEILAEGGYVTVETLAPRFDRISGLAVDGGGNVFVSGARVAPDGHMPGGEINEILADGGYATFKSLGIGVIEPDNIAVDASDNIFVVDSGDRELKEILAKDHYTKVITLAAGINAYTDVRLSSTRTPFSVDSSSNVFLYDFHAKAAKEIVKDGGYTMIRTLGRAAE